jgi:hypothetical protein
MPTLAVAVVKADRNIMANLTIDPIEAFRHVVAEAEALLSAFDGARMIVAPEYFLNERKTGNVNVPEVMSKSDKHALYKKLKTISAGAGNTILVAGSIFYKKGLLSKVGLNVCPVLRNGNIIYKYYKAFDDGSLGQNDPNAEYDSKDTGPIFQSDGITFGIEICGDIADVAAAQRNWQGQDNSGSVQVHIVIADGAGMPNNKIQAGPGGYAIMTDLQSGTTSVRYSAGGNWQGTFAHGALVRGDTDVQHTAAGLSNATGAKIRVYDLTV